MDYYIAKDGQHSGPYHKEQLIANGLTPNSLVWRQGMTAWMPANQLPELSDIIADAPPPLDVVIVKPKQHASTPPAAPSANQQLKQELEQSQRLKQQLQDEVDRLQQSHVKSPKPIAKETRPVNKPKSESKPKSTTKASVSKKNSSTTKSSKKAKTKYDHPVADWRNESIWLLAFVVIHAAMALLGWTTWWYLYLDIAGALLSITGIAIGSKIKSLNKISYVKDSASRLEAERWSTFNGFLVSATAAAGFLIILVQSAHYIYVA